MRTCGDLTLDSDSTFLVECDANVAELCTQLLVTGTVTLAGTLDRNLGFAVVAGGSRVIVANDEVDAVVGTFTGLPEA